MKDKYLRGFLKGIFLVQVFIIIIIIGVSWELEDNLLQKFSGLNLQSILMPLGNLELNQAQASSLLKETNYMLASPLTGNWLDNVYLPGEMPVNLMAASIPALAYEDDISTDNGLEDENQELKQPPLKLEEENPAPANADKNYTLFKGRKVVFYCTHSAESYIPDSGEARLEGKKGLVNVVTATLAQNIAQRGLQAQFVDTIHDYPDYNSSYTNSRKTVKTIVGSNKNILAIFDIHRDSIPGAGIAETVEVKDRKSARILIIVGTDQRKSHPHWRENLKFAEKLYEQAQQMYPGLIKTVRTKAGTYNQEFHDHALLLEFGSDHNSLKEANYAAELFSEVLVEVLKEEIY